MILCCETPLWGSNVRFESSSKLLCGLVDPTELTTAGPHCGSPRWGPIVDPQDCVLYCVLLCGLHCALYCALYRCTVLRFWLYCARLWNPSGGLHRGFPYKQCEAPSVGPMWRSAVGLKCAVRLGTPRMGSTAVYQGGAPVRGSSVRLLGHSTIDSAFDFIG